MRPLREAIDGSGELSNGALVSERDEALVAYFRRTHQQHHDEAPALYRRAAAAVWKLRRELRDPWDCWVWYALMERLHRAEHDVDWMRQHAEPRCPRCSSRLAFEDAAAGHAHLICASRCGADSSDRTVEVHERIQSVYETAFEPIDRLEILTKTT